MIIMSKMFLVIRIYTYVKGGVKPSVKVEFTDHSGEKRILRMREKTAGRDCGA